MKFKDDGRSDVAIAPAEDDGAANAAIRWTQQLVTILSTMLAVRADRELQHILRIAAGAEGDGPFAIGEPGRQPWLKIAQGKTKVLRDRPSGLPVVHLAVLFEEGGKAADMLHVARMRTSAIAEASRLIGSLFASELPDRRTMKSVLEWAPALEQVAYAASAAITLSLDEVRSQVRWAVHADEVPSDTRILRYWLQAHALANLTILAADAPAQQWLVDTAHSFEWAHWTPTLPLIRERTVWLAACAARSCAAFGEGVIQRYFSVLEKSESPLKQFDALFGLSAIGIASPSARSTIIKELRLRRSKLDYRSLTYGDVVRLAYNDALATLAGSKTREQKATLETAGIRWKSGSSHGLATPGALREDPLRYSSSGCFVGFAMLPIIFETPLANFYPEADSPSVLRKLTMSDAVLALRRAWTPPETR